ncbi:MAG: peptidoglycan DD-metalloendopeptidase family protein [Bacteroidetes bacterium]|nr:peptidoglycan DD-metalloendopeptidase family protein [Bacteroidota bacterium]
MFSQTNQRVKLEKSKKEIEEEIAYTNKLLTETKKSRQLSVNRVVILNNQIQKREKLINNINNQVNDLNDQVNINQMSLDELRQELTRLRKEYASMIYQTYKNRNAYNRLMFLFAARDFNQAYNRLQYFRQYSDYRHNQVALILKTQQRINTKIQELNTQKNDKLSLVKSKETEKERLQREKEEKNQTITQLQQKEKDLRTRLKEKEKALKRLQTAIENMIAEEIKKSTETNKKTGTKTTTPPTTLALTPEEKELSSSFSSNRGKLPWPTEKGIVSSTFGEHEHPVLKGIRTKNNGINIVTAGGSNVRAVFNGTVTGIMSIPNLNEVVIIRHGEYLSVYSNLETVYVKKGDKVKTKQSIGKVYTDPDESKTEMHFEIWAGKTLLDPMNWLAR